MPVPFTHVCFSFHNRPNTNIGDTRGKIAI
jgi:hypothetical protein